MITLEQFCRAIPCNPTRGALWHPHMVRAMQTWGINTPSRIAGFLANVSQESAKLAQLEENLNYSAQGMANTWPGRYAVDSKATPKVPNALALSLHRNPKEIANVTYAGRMGNGPRESGDGWKYRGRGPTQTTGHDNYQHAGWYLRLNLLNDPDLLLTPEHGSGAAGWHWGSNHCNELMDAGNFKGACIATNGGLIGYEDGNTTGLDDRVELWANAKAALGI